MPPALPLLVAPRLGLSWVALTGPCVRSAGSRRVFPRPGPPPPGQVGHEQGSWPRPAQPLGAECCEECAPSAGKGQSWGLVLGGCGCTPGAWSWVTEARRARPRLGDLSPSASAGSCSRKGPSRPGVPLGQTGLQAVPPSLALGCQPTGSWVLGGRILLLPSHLQAHWDFRNPLGVPLEYERCGVRAGPSPGAQAGMEQSIRPAEAGRETPWQGLRVCPVGGPMRTITPGLTAVVFRSPGRPPVSPACRYSAGAWGLVAWGLGRHCHLPGPLLVPSWEFPWPKSSGQLGWIQAWISAGDWAEGGRGGQRPCSFPTSGPGALLLLGPLCGPGGGWAGSGATGDSR